MVAPSLRQLALSATSLAALVASSPVQDGAISVPVSKRTTGGYDIRDVLRRDLARHAIRAPGSNKRADSGSQVATNGDNSYFVDIKFCDVTYSLIIDTGSSNTWAGNNNQAVHQCGVPQTNPSEAPPDNGVAVDIPYGSGSAWGEERIGPLSFGGLTAKNQSFGAMWVIQGIATGDGILGLGPFDLTAQTLASGTAPTFTNTLHSEGVIKTEVVGVYFKAEKGGDTNDANGQLTIGGVDSSKYQGSLAYFPTSTVSPYNRYWGIDGLSVYYGSTLLGAATGSAIVDTGTTLMFIPGAAFQSWLTHSSGSTDSSTGLAHWTKKPTENLVVKIGSTSLTLTPAQYLVPESQYTEVKITGTGYFGWVAAGQDILGEDFVLGQKFLENFYSVYDTTNSRIGFAPAR